MVFAEAWNQTCGVASALANFTMKMGGNILQQSGIVQKSPPVVQLPSNLKNLEVSKLVHVGHPVLKLAALSGAMATVLGAYGAHTLSEEKDNERKKEIFKTANQYHFYHTLSLFGAVLSQHPRTTCAVMTLGMILFCGTCYYHAFTGDERLKSLTPVGGIFMIMGWLTLLF